MHCPRPFFFFIQFLLLASFSFKTYTCINTHTHTHTNLAYHLCHRESIPLYECVCVCLSFLLAALPTAIYPCLGLPLVDYGALKILSSVQKLGGSGRESWVKMGGEIKSSNWGKFRGEIVSYLRAHTHTYSLPRLLLYIERNTHTI